jgi:hypothetical protein
MLQQSWLEFIIAALDFSSLLILLMLISLLNVGLKWLPSLNKVQFLLWLFFFVKAVLILTESVEHVFAEMLYLLNLPLILLLGPVITTFSRSALSMKKTPPLNTVKSSR